MAEFTVRNYADLVSAIASANANTSGDNLRFANDIILGPNETIDLTTPANSGTLRFRQLVPTTADPNPPGTPTLVVQSALNINDNTPATPQPSFTIGPFRLVIGNGGTEGSLSGNVRADDGGILEFNRSADSTYTGTFSVEEEDNALLNDVAGTTLTLNGAAGTNGLSIRASQGNGAASPYELEIGGAGNGVISGIIADGGTAARPGNIDKTGTGTWTLSGNNTYVGTTTASEGTLVVSNSNGLGAVIGSGGTAAAAGTIVADGATLGLQGGIAIGNEALSLAGDGVNDGGALRNIGGLNSYGGTIALTADASIVSAAGTLSLGGAVSSGTDDMGAQLGPFGLTLGGAGNGSLSGVIQSTITTVTKEGTGTWALSGANAYAGGTTLEDGTLELGTLTSAGTGAITFGDDAQTLQLDVAGTLGNALSEFGLGDIIDLRAINSDGATFSMSGNTLTVNESMANGGDSNSFAIGPAMDGYKYALSSDGAGGTNVTMVEAVPPDAPSAPTITAATDSGVSSTDGVTRVKRPTFTGTAEANSTVTLYNGQTVIGTGTTDANGTYTVTPDQPFTEGTYTVSVTATDAAGNISTASSGTSITIDNTAPTKPGAPSISAASDTGTSSTDGITADSTPTFTGSAEAGSTVTLYDGTTKLGVTAVVGLNGTYTITASELADGAHSIRVVATDAAGNNSALSAGARVVVDTANPVRPAAPTLTAASDTGSSQSDGITRDTTPTFTGTVEGGAIVKLYDGDTLVGTSRANAFGMYGVTASALAAGTHSLSVTATDAAGNVSTVSPSTSVNIDNAIARPAAPTLVAASDTGRSSTDGITVDNTPTFTGSTEAGSTVTLYDGRTIVGSTVADSNGAYTVTSSQLADGTHSILVGATDVAGNKSQLSPSRRVIVDTQAPDVAITTEDETVTTAKVRISGTGEFGNRVTLADDDTGVVYGTVTVGRNGTWSGVFTMQEGENEIGATAVDLAGNETASDEIVITYDPSGGMARMSSFAAPASADAGLTNALFSAAFAAGYAEAAVPPAAMDPAAALAASPA